MPICKIQSESSGWFGHCDGTIRILKIVEAVFYLLITNMIPESIVDSSFSVFAVSNMGRTAKLTIKWS